MKSHGYQSLVVQQQFWQKDLSPLKFHLLLMYQIFLWRKLRKPLSKQKDDVDQWPNVEPWFDKLMIVQPKFNFLGLPLVMLAINERLINVCDVFVSLA